MRKHMIGILAGGIGAIGLAKLWHVRRHGFGGGEHCGPRRHGWRGGPRRFLKELDATPEQKAALRQSAWELVQAIQAGKPPVNFGAVREALTAESVDRADLVNKLREPVDSPLPDAIANVVERLRGSLSAEQRAKLSAMMARRFGGDAPSASPAPAQ